jgi:hypothetical protein
MQLCGSRPELAPAMPDAGLAAKHEFGKDEVKTESNRVHRRDAGKLAVSHPFSGGPRIKSLAPKLPHPAESEADWNGCRSMVPPIYVPNRISRLHVPSLSQAVRQARLKKHDILRRRPGPYVGEGNRVLNQKPNPKIGHPGKRNSRSRARLPRARTCPAVGSGWKNNNSSYRPSQFAALYVRPLPLKQVVHLCVRYGRDRMAARAGSQGANFKCESYELFRWQERKRRDRNDGLKQKNIGLRAGLKISRCVEVEKSDLS